MTRGYYPPSPHAKPDMQRSARVPRAGRWLSQETKVDSGSNPGQPDRSPSAPSGLWDSTSRACTDLTRSVQSALTNECAQVTHILSSYGTFLSPQKVPSGPFWATPSAPRQPPFSSLPPWISSVQSRCHVNRTTHMHSPELASSTPCDALYTRFIHSHTFFSLSLFHCM